MGRKQANKITHWQKFGNFQIRKKEHPNSKTNCGYKGRDLSPGVEVESHIQEKGAAVPKGLRQTAIAMPSHLWITCLAGSFANSWGR